MGGGRGKKGDQEKCMKRKEVEGEEWGAGKKRRKKEQGQDE